MTRADPRGRGSPVRADRSAPPRGAPPSIRAPRSGRRARRRTSAPVVRWRERRDRPPERRGPSPLRPPSCGRPSRRMLRRHRGGRPRRRRAAASVVPCARAALEQLDEPASCQSVQHLLDLVDRTEGVLALAAGAQLGRGLRTAEQQHGEHAAAAASSPSRSSYTCRYRVTLRPCDGCTMRTNPLAFNDVRAASTS